MKTFVLPLALSLVFLSGCSHLSSPDSPSAFRSPPTEPTANPYFDTTVEQRLFPRRSYRGLSLQRGTEMNSVFRALGRPSHVLQNGKVWVYTCYNPDVRPGNSSESNSLVVAFDDRNIVREMGLVNEDMLQLILKRNATANLALLDFSPR